MSKAHIASEWGFKSVVTQNAYLNFKYRLKLGLQPVRLLYRVACILTNAHICLYGSITSAHFDIEPLSLEDYLCL